MATTIQASARPGRPSEIVLWESHDAVRWTEKTRVLAEASTGIGWQYLTIVDASGRDAGVVGSRFSIYCGKSPTDQGRSEVWRFTADLIPTSNAPAAPPAGTSVPSSPAWTRELDATAARNGGTLGLAAIERALAQGATRGAINPYLTQHELQVGQAAAAAGHGPISSWREVIDGAAARSGGGGVGLSALEAAVRLGASKAQVDAYLTWRSYSVGAAAAAQGFGPGR